MSCIIAFRAIPDCSNLTPQEVILLSNLDQKTMVLFAIEHTLLKTSKSTLEAVESRLRQEYNCTIPECYEHPEYLVKVLKDIFGASYKDIIKDVNLCLEEFAYQKPIVEFLEKMR